MTLSGRSAGLLSLDRVSVRDGDRLVGHLFVVELEFRPSPDLAVVAAELGADLAAQEGLRPDAETKLVHALDLLSAAQAR